MGDFQMNSSDSDDYDSDRAVSLLKTLNFFKK